MAMDPDVFDSLIYKLEIQTDDVLAPLAKLGVMTGQVERVVGDLSRKEMILNDIRVESVRRTRGMLESTARYNKDFRYLVDLYARGAITAKQYNYALRQVNQAYIQAGNPVTNFSNTLHQMGQRATRLGTALTIGVTTPLVILSGVMTNTFTKWDKSVNQARSVLGATTEEVARLREETLRLSFSGEIAQGPAELAGVLDDLGRSGRNTEASLNALGITAKFATANTADLEKATNELVESQEAIGLASDNASISLSNLAHIGNVFTEAARFGQTEALNFAKAINNQAGPTLRQFNKDLEEGTAALIAYSKQGTQGSEAGTFLSRALLLLSKAANDATDAHKTMGFEVFDPLSGKMRNLADIAENLENITRGMSEEMVSATLKVLGFEQRTQRVILPLIGMSRTMRESEARLRGVGDVMDRVAKEQMESFSNKLAVVWNKAEVLAIGIIQDLLPAIEGLIDEAKELADWWDTLSNSGQKTALTLAGIVAAAGPLLVVLGSIATGTSNTILALQHLSLTAAGTGAAANAARVALSSLAALGVIALGAAILGTTTTLIDYVTKLGDWGDEIERLLKLNNELKEVSERAAAKQVQGLWKINEADVRIETAKKLLDQENKNHETKVRQLEEQRKEIERLQTMSMGGVGSQAQNVVEAGFSREALEDAVTHGTGILEVDSGVKAKFREEIALYMELEDAVEGIEKKQRDYRNVISESEAQMKNMEEQQKKNTQELEKNQAALQKALAQEKLAQKADKRWKEVTESLTRYNRVLERTAESVRQSVLTPQEKLNEELNKLDTLLMKGKISWDIYARAVKKAGAEADELINKNYNVLVQKGKDLIKEFRTPEQVFNERLSELAELRTGGFIDADTWRRAAEDARQTYERALGEDVSVDVRFNLQDIQGVEADSAEALSRIRKTMFLGKDTMRKGIASPEDPGFGPTITPIHKDVFDGREDLKAIREGIKRLVEFEEDKNLDAAKFELAPANIG